MRTFGGDFLCNCDPWSVAGASEFPKNEQKPEFYRNGFHRLFRSQKPQPLTQHNNFPTRSCSDPALRGQTAPREVPLDRGRLGGGTCGDVRGGLLSGDSGERNAHSATESDRKRPSSGSLVGPRVRERLPLASAGPSQPAPALGSEALSCHTGGGSPPSPPLPQNTQPQGPPPGRTGVRVCASVSPPSPAGRGSGETRCRDGRSRLVPQSPPPCETPWHPAHQQLLGPAASLGALGCPPGAGPSLRVPGAAGVCRPLSLQVGPQHSGGEGGPVRRWGAGCQPPTL